MSKYRVKFRKIKFVASVLSLTVASLLLTACTVTEPQIITPTPLVTQRAAAQGALPTITPLPPLPTATPRPTLEALPSSLKSAKISILQAGFGGILNTYFFPLNSADVYEVALRGISNTLKNAGIKNPQVPVPNFTTDPDNNWALFQQAYGLTLNHYQGQLAEEKLAYGAFQEVVNSIAECSTAFYNPTDGADFIQNISGTNPSVGLGILVTSFTDGEGLYITRVIPNSPADKAGLKVGDNIRGVDGKSIVGIDLVQAYRLLLGGDKAVAGTTVNLEVSRAGSGTTDKIDITRGSTIIGVFERKTINNNLGYLRINSFPLATQTQLTQLNKLLDDGLKEFTSQKIKGLVIDLRGVRYGNYRTVLSFLSRFAQGSTYMSVATQNQGKEVRLDFGSSNNVTPINLPLAVLVDGSTAYDAEIFAWGLQNTKSARIFGVPTAGCVVGSDQLKLNDDSVLNIARFRVISTPTQLDSFVDQVVPNEAINFDRQTLEQGKDTILEKALAYLQGL